MAYGQTGSGKTYTMGSEAQHVDDTNLVTSSTGLIPRFVHDLFRLLAEKKDLSDRAIATSDCSQQVLVSYQLEASFLEVYGEDVHDLLDNRSGRSEHSLPLREDANGGIVISGLTHRPIHTATEALAVLHDGTLNRTTAATLMNLTSSRSHAVFTVTLTQSHRQMDAGGPHADSEIACTSRFTFVDLAGSERMKKTGAEGERAREGIKINEGLLALGNVINALADDERKSASKIHVPYRQSKLTRLLQDALGGNSQTLFLACVSPADTNANETLSTLRYANRARNIRNAPTRNVDPHTLELQRLMTWNRILETEVVRYKFIPNGEVPEESLGNIMQRKDVMEYLDSVRARVTADQGSTQFPSLPWSNVETEPRALNWDTDTRLLVSSTDHSLPAAQLSRIGTQGARGDDAQKSSQESFDTAILSEVNPDEELAILDQLLDLHHQDQQFDKSQKEGDSQLREVNDELAKQEGLLLHLRDSLKVYHSMKAKYEQLVLEAQQLEEEKQELAELLEKSNADPRLGCTKSIKKRLEMVEQSLSRTRNEARQHREMCRKAEQEAQKCKALERKISELKTGRANLIKQQKEAAMKHRQFTESKTREIMTLKKKERNASMTMSKLQCEVAMQRKQLEKRKEYCDKLAAKLKQTETHLMSLLSRRQRDLRDRSSVVHRISRSAVSVTSFDEIKFAPESEEVQSLRFMLEQSVENKVKLAEMSHLYEEKIGEYSACMRQLVALVKEHEALRRESNDSSDSGRIRDLEQSIEGAELKTELLGSDLEELRAHLNSSEVLGWDSSQKSFEKLVEATDAPVLRTLLLDALEHQSASEVRMSRPVACAKVFVPLIYFFVVVAGRSEAT
jgi:Kinesin motor domain